MAIEGVRVRGAIGHVLGGHIGGDEADLTDAPVRLGNLVAVIGIVESFADDETASGVREEMEIDGAALFHQSREGGDAVIDELEGDAAGIAAVFEVIRGVTFCGPIEAEELALVASLSESGADAAVTLDEVFLGDIVAVDENDEVIAFLGFWSSDEISDEGGTVDFVRGIRAMGLWNFEEARRSRFAGKRTAFNGTGANNIVGHDVRGYN